MQIKIDVPDLKRFLDGLRRYPQIVAPRFDQAIRLSIFAVEREGKIRTPVDTGRLRGSYVSQFGNLSGSVGPTADYAFYVHEGTQFMEGRPFLAEAVDATADQVEGFFAAALSGAFDEIARST